MYLDVALHYSGQPERQVLHRRRERHLRRVCNTTTIHYHYVWQSLSSLAHKRFTHDVFNYRKAHGIYTINFAYKFGKTGVCDPGFEPMSSA